MIRLRGGYLSRINRDGKHHWLGDETIIEKIILAQPQRNKKARKAKGKADWDPIG
jgi:hypothetical protein